MTIYVDWVYDNQKVVMMNCQTAWTWQEFHDASAKAHELIRSVPHEVHLIIWHQVELPDNNLLTHFMRASKDQPDNTGRVIVVAPRSSRINQFFMESMSDIVGRVQPDKSHIEIMTTIEEAMAFINELEATA